MLDVCWYSEVWVQLDHLSCWRSCSSSYVCESIFEERRNCLSHIVLITDIALYQKISKFLRFKFFFHLIISPIFDFIKIVFILQFPILPLNCITHIFHKVKIYQFHHFNIVGPYSWFVVLQLFSGHLHATKKFGSIIFLSFWVIKV